MSPLHQRKDKARWNLLPYIGIPVLLILIGGCLIFIAKNHNRNELERVRAELRSHGEPLTWEEMNIQTSSSGSKSYPKFEAAAVTLKTRVEQMHRDHPDIKLPGGMPFVEPGKALVISEQPTYCAQYLEMAPRDKLIKWSHLKTAWEPSRAALDDVKDCLREPLLFPVHLQSNTSPYPQLKILIETVKALQYDTMLALHEKDWERTRQNLIALNQLNHCHQQVPCTISLFIDQLTLSTQQALIWQALERSDLTHEQTTHLYKLWQPYDLLKSSILSTRGERILLLGAVEQLKDNNSSYSSYYALGPEWQAFGQAKLYQYFWSDQDMAGCLTAHQEVIDLLRDACNGSNYRAIALRIENLIAAHDNVSEYERVSRAVTHLTMVSSDSYLYRLFEVEANMRLTTMALALERYKLAHRSYPKKLEALIPTYLETIPLDPFGDGSSILCYLPKEKTYLLYSRGINGLDDGGNAEMDSADGPYRWTKGKDIVWPEAP